jgi:Flp pilus assembly protein TadD
MMNRYKILQDLLAGGQFQQALQAAEAALKIDFDNADLYNIAGVCTISLGDQERAEHYWRLTIRLNPNASEAFFNLGLLCARSQREEEAEQYYRKAIGLDPVNSEAYTNLGLMLERQKCEEEAEQCQRIAVKLNPESAEIHSNLAGLLANLSDGSPGAENHYLQAITLSPGSAFPYSNYSVFLTNQRRDNEAEHCFRKALAMDSVSAWYGGKTPNTTMTLTGHCPGFRFWLRCGVCPECNLSVFRKDRVRMRPKTLRLANPCCTLVPILPTFRIRQPL